MAKEIKIPKVEKIAELVRKFSATELVIFSILALVACVSALTLAFKLNRIFMVEIPDKGGKLSEGVIGIPRFINPVLATSDVDRDLTTLIYSGLLKNKNGGLVNDLALSYTISPDGLTYDFTIKNSAKFHDGKPITADDVVYTIEQAQNPDLKSPKRADWADVKAEKTGDKQVRFTLNKPYAPFIQNTTIGILPKHIWKDTATAEQFTFSKFNSEPIGSGPYQISNIDRDGSGLPISYSLESFDEYVLGEPYISDISINLYPSVDSLEEAWTSGKITSLYGPSTKILNVTEAEVGTDGLSGNTKIVHSPLPYVMAVFFNQNQAPILANLEVRQALSAAIPKDVIVDEILKGYGVSINSPLPITYFKPLPNNGAKDLYKDILAKASTTATTTVANLILEKAGWAKNPNTGVYERKTKKDKDMQVLEFSLTTSANNPEFKAIAERITDSWNSMGAKVSLKVFDSDLGQNIIRPRKFDSLLFGEIIGSDLDLYSFWHSSQRVAPGLNIAQYANSKADKLLEDARSTSDEAIRTAKYREFEQLVIADVPAAFTYSPDFIYLIPREVQGSNIKSLTTPADRWNGIEDWYINTDHVWKIFSKNKDINR